MNASTASNKTVLVLAAVAVLAAVGGGAWWLGRYQGVGQQGPAGAPASNGPGNTTSAAAASPEDPGQWSIAQGEEATRRHIRDGLKAGDTDPTTGQRIINYHDPMVPGKNFDAPAKSPFMDMMLVPRYAGGGQADSSSVSVSPRIQQNLGLRTAPAIVGALTREINVIGSVLWNERDQVLLQARATGFVEKLYVRATLDRVAAGAPLADIYVPAWVAAQEDYLALVQMQGPDLAPLRDAARQRMRLAGMSTAMIDTVVNSGQRQARYTLTAPQGGTVTELLMREGMTVMPGMTLVRIQGTSSVWAEGEVPESQAALLKRGAAVTATSPGAPGQTFKGRVQTLLPEVDTRTRTIKARLELANPGGRLVPGMLVQMQFARQGAKDSLLVPSDAVIHTGKRSVVMLAEEDGRFTPMQVTTGLEAGGQTEVLAGLKPGQQVVRSGNFLIDSEASLRGLEAKLNQAAAPKAQVYSTDAVVDALAKDSVTLTHPPIAALKWPQMQMDFRLPQPQQQPRGLAVGEKVQIEFSMQEGDVPQITSMRRLAPAAAAAAAGPAK